MLAKVGCLVRGHSVLMAAVGARTTGGPRSGGRLAATRHLKRETLAAAGYALTVFIPISFFCIFPLEVRRLVLHPTLGSSHTTFS